MPKAGKTVAKNSKSKMGRPDKYDPAFCNIVKNLYLMIPNIKVEEVAELLGISVKTYYNWQEKYSAFEQSVNEGKVGTDLKAIENLADMVTGYEIVEVHINKTTGDEIEVRRQSKPDLAAIRYWLNNRRSENWRERRDNNVTHDLGDPFKEMMERVAARKGRIPGRSVE